MLHHDLGVCVEACKHNSRCNSLVVDVTLSPTTGAPNYNCSQYSCTDEVEAHAGASRQASMQAGGTFYIRVGYPECTVVMVPIR